MNRTRFMATLSMLTVVPSAVLGTLRNPFSRNKGFKVSAGEGRKYGHLKLKGVNANVLDVKISGSDTDGDLAVFEQTSLSKGRGTPLHIHPSQDEVFYVIEGEYRFKVGDVLYQLKAGDSIFLPRKVPHAWTQVADTGRMIVLLQPAGKLENFFVTMAGMDHEPTSEEVVKVFAANDMQVVGPPLSID